MDWLAEVEAVGGETAAIGRGTFVVTSATRDADAAALAAMKSIADRHELPFEHVPVDTVPQLAPGRETPAAAAYLADEGWVDASRLCDVLRAACAAAGVEILDGAAHDLATERGRTAGVRTSLGALVQADQVVLCSSAAIRDIRERSRDYEAVLPRVVDAKGVGLIMDPRTPDAAPPHAVRTPNREFACGLHVVPRADGATYVGATNRVSRHAGMTGGATADEIGFLIDRATSELVRGLPSWDIAGVVFGHRPLVADGHTVVGSTAVDGLAVATGTYRNGVLLAPLMAETVAADLRSGTPDPMNSFSPIDGIRIGLDPPSPADLLRDGLEQIMPVLRESRDARWRALVEDGIDVVTTRGLTPGAAQLLREIPLVEMVPEVLIELGRTTATADIDNAVSAR